MSRELVSTRLILPFAEAEDGLLLARRVPQSRHYPELWELPGGTVEANETIIEATRREAYEETGITVAMGNLALLACDRDWCRDNPEVPYTVYTYVSESNKQDLREITLDPSEHTEYTLASLAIAMSMNITPDSRRSLDHYRRKLRTASAVNPSYL